MDNKQGVSEIDNIKSLVSSGKRHIAMIRNFLLETRKVSGSESAIVDCAYKSMECIRANYELLSYMFVEAMQNNVYKETFSKLVDTLDASTKEFNKAYEGLKKEKPQDIATKPKVDAPNKPVAMASQPTAMASQPTAMAHQEQCGRCNAHSGCGDCESEECKADIDSSLASEVERNGDR